MADSAEVDAAVVRRLMQDDTLAGLMPGGVFMDRGPEGVDAFVLVSLLSHSDEDMFDATAYEASIYLVKAVGKGTEHADVDAAASRIKVLLDQNDPSFDASNPLAPTGYGVMKQERIERVRYAEVDQETDETWQHAGGHYEVWATA